MKFKCKHCGVIVKRDARESIFKEFITKSGYKSYCAKAGKDVFLKREP